MTNRVLEREGRSKVCVAARDMARTNFLQISMDLLWVSSLKSSGGQDSAY